MHMAKLDIISNYIGEILNLEGIPDYPGAVNGLQLENASGEVTHIASAVDATLPVVEKAVAAGADMLLVHHGMFWQGAQKITGSVFRRIKLAMDNGLAIYSAHIPLDVHPVYGNNALLAAKLGFNETETFFPWKGIQLGIRAEVEIPRDSLVARLTQALDNSPVHLCPGGPETVRRVGIITGGAGSEVAAMAASGVDTFITGEGPHWSYTAAEELGINILYGGHYATETFGVRGLGLHLAEKFGVKNTFIDHPTGL
jgi:dinuclear metal center YbgI/SA1388 family protein